MADSCDVIIIGGGVTGSAAAYFLAAGQFDGSIVVVERDPNYAEIPSVRATGGIRQQFSTPENIRIGLFGAEFVKNVDRYLSIEGEVPEVGFRERGYLLLASQRALPVMRENHAVQLKNGADIVYQTNEELNTRFPWIESGGLAGGFLGVRNEGWLDPYSLLQAFRRKAISLGVKYIADEVTTLRCENGRVSEIGLESGESMCAGVVLNAAGARDAAGLAAQVGIRLPVEPRKRCAFLFDCRQSIGQTPLVILPNGVAFRSEGERYLTVVSPPPERDPSSEEFDIDYTLFDDIIWPTLAQYVLVPLRFQYIGRERHPRTPARRRESPGCRGLLGSWTHAVAGSGTRSQRADYLRRISDPRFVAFRLSARARQCTTDRDQLLLNSLSAPPSITSN